MNSFRVCLMVMMMSVVAGSTLAADDRVPQELNRYVIPIFRQGENFDDPIQIESVPYYAYGNTCGWENDADSYPGCTETPSASPDVIYSYTPSHDVWVNATVCNSQYAVRLYVVDAARTLLDCNELSCANQQGDFTGAQLESLPLAAGMNYCFVIDGCSDECGEYSFDLLLGDQPLPVELIGFEVTPGNGSITAAWRTAAELDNDYFELTRDGSVVAHVDGAGNSSVEHDYSWTDRDVQNGTPYEYALFAVDLQGGREQLASDAATPGSDLLVEDYALEQNYPNPFNPETQITFNLTVSGVVSLDVYDVTGRTVASLLNRELTSGRHTVSFNGADLPSGVYLYRLTTSGFTAQRKMVLLR